jgi:guanosine-3',5'-bis(diphosphate) 3'-pyrophosphohydrolase
MALAIWLGALRFSAMKHRDQRRKDRDASPSINHGIEVPQLLATTGSITDPAVLAAAVLHDRVEDPPTPAAELDERFGVRRRLRRALVCLSPARARLQIIT